MPRSPRPACSYPSRPKGAWLWPCSGTRGRWRLSPPGWRPVFLDYPHLGFTDATAFSPADVMPLTHRAKYTMLVQSSAALALFALVVARAVNAFT